MCKSFAVCLVCALTHELVLHLVLFGTALAAVRHRGAAPTVSQLIFVGGGGPALRANPVIPTVLLFFGGDSDSDLDSFGAQLVNKAGYQKKKGYR